MLLTKHCILSLSDKSEINIYSRLTFTRMNCMQRGNMNEDQCGWQFQHMDNNNILIVSRRRRQEMSKYGMY